MTEKQKQYGAFALVVVLIGSVFAIGLMLMSPKKEEQQGRYYKKQMNTGVESLTDKELWIEKSTNDLDEMKQRNEILNKEVETLKKLITGLGERWGSEKSFIENAYKNQTNAEENSNSDKRYDNFSDIADKKSEIGQLPQRIGGGLKQIKFASVETEHNLDSNFIFASTSAKCVLLGSVTVSAGISSPSNPQPVLLQIIDAGNLPNDVKGFLKGARIIGAAYGELSSESVVIRLERLVKIDKKRGIGIDIPVKGYVTSEYGNTRIKGVVYDKAGAIVRNAAVAGFLSGMSSFVASNGNSNVTFEPNSGLAQFSPQAGAKLLEQGASKGIGNAVDKYADFIIKRAEQLQPVIKIDGGRVFEVVFTESVKASTVHMKKVKRRMYEQK